MEYIMIWLICGVLCGIIASSKGRNVGGWVVGGMLLGLVGVIIIALLPSLKKN